MEIQDKNHELYLGRERVEDLLENAQRLHVRNEKYNLKLWEYLLVTEMLNILIV